MPAPASDHRRATADRNVQAILDAAEDLLERHGQTSMSAVAAQAGVSRVTLYAHFPAWDRLLEAVVERAVGHTAAVLAAAEPERGPALAALERLLAAGWQELGRYPAMAQAAAERLSPAAFTRSHQVVHERVHRLAERGQADGSFRTDLPASWLTASTFALIHTCASEVRAGRLDRSGALAVLTATIVSLYTSGPGKPGNERERPSPQ